MYRHVKLYLKSYKETYPPRIYLNKNKREKKSNIYKIENNCFNILQNAMYSCDASLLQSLE